MKNWDVMSIFECNKLCLHLHLSRDSVRDRDYPVNKLAYWSKCHLGYRVVDSCIRHGHFCWDTTGHAQLARGQYIQGYLQGGSSGATSHYQYCSNSLFLSPGLRNIHDLPVQPRWHCNTSCLSQFRHRLHRLLARCFLPPSPARNKNQLYANTTK